MDYRKYKHWMERATQRQCFTCLVLAPASPQRGDNAEHYLKDELHCSNMQERAHCVPPMKGKTLPFKYCHPEQCQIKERSDATIPMYTDVLWNSRFSDFPNPTSRWCEWAKGAVPGHASIMQYAQCTTRQLVSWGRLLNWPEWSEKKEDSLAAGKGRIGRQTLWHHAAMPQWQDGSWLALRRAICS